MNRGLNIMVNIFKRKKDILIIVSICVIIICAIKTYCDTSLTLKSVTFENRTYYFYPECIRYHVKANGYDKKLKDDADNNLYVYAAPGPGRELQPTNARMQGYGNYVFKEDTTLFDFINFCYEREYQTANNICEYTKISSYGGKKLNSNGIAVVNNFWRNMLLALGEIFNYYQDLYFFERYVNEGAELVYSANRLANNGKEFLTCMMSYIFSTNQNSASHFEVKKGDIVPFLYVKEHTNNSDLKNNPRDIARFSYLACINGWAEVTTNDLWFEEYESIFGEYDEEALCELVDEDIETLEKWYFETDAKYQNQKGNKGNALLGATIDEIIESDYSISQQLEATDYYLQNIEHIGDYKENMARNELMAKYMMENSHIGDIIKDYNVGITFITENLQRGTSESKNTSTAVLSDFQVLEFDHKLNKDGHSDEDGLSDLTELTNNTKWVNITGPAEKTYNDMLSKGKTTKTMNDVFEDFVKKSPGMVKYENDKLYYKTYDYNSNPMLNDTDFDGLMDNIDSNKISGNFKGNASSIGNVDFVSDFRYFFVDNEKYNDELSTMSLMMSNLADGGSAPLHSGSQNIIQYMSNLGFITPISEKHSFRISATENISGNLYLGKKTIQVGANKKSIKRYKDVYGIFLGGFNTEDNYKKLLSNFDKEEVASFYQNIADDIISYINTNKPATVNPHCYWVTGYSVAGGIAGEVASRLTNVGEVFCYTFGATNTNTTGSGAYACIKNVINEDDLYPKIYDIDDGFHRSGMLYNDSIYDNLKREYNELVGGFRSYKVTAKRTNSIKQKLKTVREKVTFINYINGWNRELAKFLKYYFSIIDIFYVGYENEFHPYQSQYSTELVNMLNGNKEGVEKAHELKSYYVLSKFLNGFDLNNEDEGWTEYDESIESEEYIDESTEEDEEYQERLNILLNAIETVGKAYLDNVYTYLGAGTVAYTGEESIENRIAKKVQDQNRGDYDVIDTIFNEKKKMKTSTITAYNKWNDRKDYIYEKIYEQVKNNVVPNDGEMTEERQETINNLSKQTIKNVYTQMKTVANARTTDNPTAIHYLELFDNYSGSGNNLTIYNFDNTIKLGKANTKTFVGDDCSCFATAVYWYYLNQLERANYLNKIDLWTTGSSRYINKSNFANTANPTILDILLKNDFDIYKWEVPDSNTIITNDYYEHNIYLNTDFKLQPGDLLYRNRGQNGAKAHVEFYLSDEHSFGWGDIQSSYENENNSKHFKIIRDLDNYNIGKTRTANQVSSGYIYRIENNDGGGIYNTVKRFTDYNCRYDYVIRLKKKANEVEVEDE